MNTIKFVLVLAVLFALSFDALGVPFGSRPSAQEEDVNPSKVSDNNVEEQKRGRGGCKYGCCGSYAYGQCSACCSRSQAEAVEVSERNAVEEQKRGRGGCKYGCCGSYAYGQCSACCSRSQAEATEVSERNAVDEQKRSQAEAAEVSERNAVEEQKRGRGGCKYGCCGSYAYGQCSACCPRKMTATEEEKEESEVAEP